MVNTDITRRLAAILAADVAGYSRLMEADEVGTLTALKGHRRDVIDPTIATHHGRLVKTTGDGLLVEFASVVDAIGCAVAIQRGMLLRNATVAEDKRIVLRIGVNIGDIIIEGADIFGDGVNVAARLEGLCEPGGICISRAANEQIRDKLSLSFADLGEHAVKNISRAVGVYGLTARDIAALPEMPEIAPAASIGTRRFRSAAIAAAGVAALLLGGAAWWGLGERWFPRPAETPQGFQAQLTAALAKHLPKGPSESQSFEADAYVRSKTHRAMAIARQTQKTWRSSQWPSPEIAEERVLEKCQQAYDEPCALIATNDVLAKAGADGTLAVRDAPRVRYSGIFNPDRIPGVRDDVARRMDVAGYPGAAGPKAAAYQAAGILHVVTGAPSQRAAEEQALRACNDDPARRIGGGSGPCYLYAIDNQVVLPLRATGPITAAAAGAQAKSQAPPAAKPVAQQNPAAPANASEAAFREGLLAALARVAPAYTNREPQVSQYLAGNAHKALTAYPPSGSWRTRGWETAAMAEERALESCQIRYGGPCVLLAVNDAVTAPADGAEWPRRSMPRVTYDGPFDPGQIPTSHGMRTRPDVMGYGVAPGPKAAALHPIGRLFVVTGAPTQRAAEEQALAACNGDPERDGRDGVCFLYAIGNTVVLPKRLTVAASPAQ
jgi:class 3 adenylate cyclase